MEILFWGALGLVAYTYVGFPLLLAVRARLRPRPWREADVTPPVSLVVCAHNEAAAIGAKLENALALDWPRERLQVLVEELTTVGCELKDYQMGLVDYVGRHQGRDVYLCWRLGEARVNYWHELHTGFAGRQPVSILDERE